MKNEGLYEFEDPKDIFAFVFQEKTRKNPLFSIRAWARKLGFRNPSHVADVLSGRRNLTVEFGLRVSDSLELTEEGKTYFETLVFLKNAKTDSEKSYYSSVLAKLKPQESKRAITPEKYATIREWYYGVLDEMTCLGDFQSDPNYLAERLGSEISPQAIRIALNDLIRLGSIESGKRGKLVRPRRVFFGTTDIENEVEDPVIRKYQRQLVEKGLVALDKQTKAESYFRMTNIPIKLKHFAEFRAHIEDFVQAMNQRESSKDADEVYLLAVQFCRLTSKK